MVGDPGGLLAVLEQRRRLGRRRQRSARSRIAPTCCDSFRSWTAASGSTARTPLSCPTTATRITRRARSAPVCSCSTGIRDPAAPMNAVVHLRRQPHDEQRGAVHEPDHQRVLRPRAGRRRTDHAHRRQRAGQQAGVAGRAGSERAQSVPGVPGLVVGQRDPRDDEPRGRFVQHEGARGRDSARSTASRSPRSSTGPA